MKKLSKKEIDVLAEKAAKFANSPEGKREIKEAFEQAQRMSEKYRRDSYIHPKNPRLFEPMTI